MIPKGENYNVKLQKYYFCNGTEFRIYSSDSCKFQVSKTKYHVL